MKWIYFRDEMQLLWRPNLFKLVQTCPNLSKLVQTCPNSSKLVQTRPNSSKLVQTTIDLQRGIHSLTRDYAY